MIQESSMKPYDYEKVENFGKKEMEVVMKAVTMQGTERLKNSVNECRSTRGNLKDNAKVWFKFVKHSVLPTSHTTNVEKKEIVSFRFHLGRERCWCWQADCNRKP